MAKRATLALSMFLLVLVPTPSLGASTGGAPSQIECTTTSSSEANLLLDCASTSQPTNEPAIAIDPANPDHMVVGANDLQGGFPPGGVEFYTTFDGGSTWTTGDLSRVASQFIGVDPSVSFDLKHGTVIYSEAVGAGPAGGCGGLLDSVSTDGGLHWQRPVAIANGYGCDGSWPYGYYDGSWVTTDNDSASAFYGRTYAISTESVKDARFPIVESHSDDGGYTWTPAQTISGSNATYCTAPPGPPSCNNTSAEARPVVSPDGSVHVAFLSVQNTAAWEGTECCEFEWMVVNSTDGGVTWSKPVHVADLEDGSRDMPNCRVGGGYASCGLTGTGLSANKPGVQPFGNIVASPTDATLYVVFTDNRNGLHDVANPVTNMDVFAMTSNDGGSTWTGPDPVSTAPGDQWNPSAAVDPATGQLGVLFDDRSYGSAAHFDVTLATGLPGGTFTTTRVTTEPSHLRNSLWFPASIAGCGKCVSWIGDFLSMAYGPDGTAHMVWTDLRRKVTAGNRTGYTENVFYASG